MTNKMKVWFTLLSSIYLWLAISASSYFVLVRLIVPLYPSTFYIFFLMGTLAFFTILIVNGTTTYWNVSKFHDSNTGTFNEAYNNKSVSSQNSRGSGHATETVFYRIYEVVAALSIYEASRGVIFSLLPPNAEITPLSALFLDPKEFMLFLIFIITSIQFIVGVSRHFESEISFDKRLNLYPLVNYILVLGEAISLLSMGISVSLGSFSFFSLWFVGLLVIDYIWILLFRVLRIGIFGFKKALGATITELDSVAREDANVYRIINRYWMNGNIAFIFYLSIMEPVASGYVIPFKNFFYMYLGLMLVGIAISTFVNSRCFSTLEKIDKKAVQ